MTGVSEARCPRCGGLNGAHSPVHVRHGNGGGHNEPCPNTPAEYPVDSANVRMGDPNSVDLDPMFAAIAAAEALDGDQ